MPRSGSRVRVSFSAPKPFPVEGFFYYWQCVTLPGTTGLGGEKVDTRDLKSLGFTAVWVRVPFRAHVKKAGGRPLAFFVTRIARKIRVFPYYPRYKSYIQRMTEFPLQGHSFITLTNLLKATGLVGTGGEANLYIVDGDVKVNGVVETQKRKKLRSGDEVEFQGGKIVVR